MGYFGMPNQHWTCKSRDRILTKLVSLRSSFEPLHPQVLDAPHVTPEATCQSRRRKHCEIRQNLEASRRQPNSETRALDQSESAGLLTPSAPRCSTCV